MRKEQFGTPRPSHANLAKTRHFDSFCLGPAEEEVLMTYLILVLVGILGFLCLCGPDGIIGPKDRY